MVRNSEEFGGNFMIRGINKEIWPTIKIYAYSQGISINDWIKEQINAGVAKIQREESGKTDNKKIERANHE